MKPLLMSNFLNQSQLESSQSHFLDDKTTEVLQTNNKPKMEDLLLMLLEKLIAEEMGT